MSTHDTLIIRQCVLKAAAEFCASRPELKSGRISFCSLRARRSRSHAEASPPHPAASPAEDVVRVGMPTTTATGGVPQKETSSS